MQRKGWTAVVLSMAVLGVGVFLLERARRSGSPSRPEEQSLSIQPMEEPAHSVGEEVPSPAAPGRRPAHDPRDGSSLPVSESFLHGIVLDDRGQPIAGARVVLSDVTTRSSGPTSGEPLGDLVTGLDGVFRFEVGDLDHTYRIVASAEGFIAQRVDRRPKRAILLRLLRAARLQGRVLSPEAARVLVFSSGPGWRDGVPDHERRLVSDGAGSYVIPEVEVGKNVTLEIVAPDCAPYTEIVGVPHPGTVEHDIVLGETILLEGRVEDVLTSRPVPGATLTLSTGSAPFVAVSDASGRFRFRLAGVLGRWVEGCMEDAAVGSRLLMASAPGYCRTHLPLVSTELRVPLLPASRIEGRVLLDDGSPAVGAKVIWESPSGIHDPALGWFLNGPGSESAMADGEGRFVLPEVLWGNGESILLVVIDDAACQWIFGVAPRGPGETVELVIRVPAGTSLQGRVEWSDMTRAPGLQLSGEGVSAGLAGLEDTLVTATRLADGALFSTTTDGGGAFQFLGLDPGPHRFLARTRQGVESEPLEVEVGTVTPILLEIAPPMHTIRGRLLHPDGSPAAGLSLIVEEQWELGGGSREPVAGGASTTTESGGFEVEVPDLEGIVHELQVGMGSTTLLRDWIDGEEWRLPSLLPARVTVRNAAGAVPTTKVRLRWSSPSLGVRGSSLFTPGPDGVDVIWTPEGEVSIEAQRSRVYLGCVRPLVADIPEGGQREGEILELEL